MMDMLRSLSGMVDAEITSADIPAALMALSKAGISLESIAYCQDLTACILLPRRDYRKVSEICKKRGDSLRLLKKRGFYWKWKALFQRPVLYVGIWLILLALVFLPTRVFFLRVEGNNLIPEKQIIEAAENCGVRFGASRRKVRSERIKNALLQELPELQWAGINTYGCVGVISVRERTAPNQTRVTERFGNVVARCDGIISSCTATRGTLLCQPGQAVQQGQVLISEYMDCGLCIQLTGAEGEIYGTTSRRLTAVTPAEYAYVRPAGRKKTKYSFLLGKKRINLWKDSGIWDSSCGRIYEENYITLPGGFRLPFGLATDTWLYYSESTQLCSESEELLRSFASDYLRQQMIAGSIAHENLRTALDGKVYRLEGEYVCTELIGVWQAEKIGEIHGKSG